MVEGHHCALQAGAAVVHAIYKPLEQSGEDADAPAPPPQQAKH